MSAPPVGCFVVMQCTASHENELRVFHPHIFEIAPHLVPVARRSGLPSSAQVALSNVAEQKTWQSRMKTASRHTTFFFLPSILSQITQTLKEKYK